MGMYGYGGTVRDSGSSGVGYMDMAVLWGTLGVQASGIWTWRYSEGLRVGEKLGHELAQDLVDSLGHKLAHQWGAAAQVGAQAGLPG